MAPMRIEAAAPANDFQALATLCQVLSFAIDWHGNIVQYATQSCSSLAMKFGFWGTDQESKNEATRLSGNTDMSNGKNTWNPRSIQHKLAQLHGRWFDDPSSLAIF